MKIVKQASGKNRIKMSKSEWTSIGKKAGWVNELPTGTPSTSTRSPEVFKVGQIWQSKINPNVKWVINEVNIKPGEASLLSITRKSPSEDERSFEKPMSLWLKLVNEGRIELQTGTPSTGTSL
jgi:hypothetical protein